MAIKKARKIQRIVLEEKKETSRRTSKQLPPDEYEDEIPAKEIELDDSTKIVISVKRRGEYGLPYADIRLFVHNEVFTGFTKKGVTFPVELLLDMVASLQEAADECEEKGLLE